MRAAREKGRTKPQKAKKRPPKKSNMELAPFPLEVPGQMFVALSFVSPTAPQRADASGFRVYGAFATLEDARAHAARVNAIDPAFDVYVAEMYRWCAWNPDPELIVDKVHSDAQLDTLLREHRAQQDGARLAFEKRIDADLAKAESSRRAAVESDPADPADPAGPADLHEPHGDAEPAEPAEPVARAGSSSGGSGSGAEEEEATRPVALSEPKKHF